GKREQPVLVIFDVDGTLIDSGDIIFEALQETLRHFRVPIPARMDALKIVGLSLHEAFVALTGDGFNAAAMAEHYKGLFGGLRASGQFSELLYPGAAEVVRNLADRADVRLGIATGKSRRGVDQLLKRLGWETVFQTIQTADDAPSKPHPQMILQALAATGISAGRTVMVGDSVHDMRMATAAGVHALAVAWGFHDQAALVDAGAQRVAAAFGDVLRVIDEMTF
ncbi:MAG: HAD-IA family hydrolase, partial [Beijerinckiaceae bacterium]